MSLAGPLAVVALIAAVMLNVGAVMAATGPGHHLLLGAVFILVALIAIDEAS